jgi:glyoxylase-like metal-dependent hydrolase (beta-lactamase superfamily II)
MIEKLVVGPMYTNSYIYADEDTGGCYIIDPGGDEEKILEALERMRSGPKKLRPRGILLTHGHLDHISAVANLYKHFKASEPDFHLGIHEADRDYLGRAAEETHKRSFNHLGIMGTEYFKAYFSEPPEPDILFTDGDTIPESELTVLLTPGHTRGSICLYHEAEKLLISGDTLFAGGIGRTDLPGGDTGSIDRSIREKLFVLPEDVRVYPGHGPETTIGEEKRSNPFFR